MDTHPIHFHLYDVQMLNRVTWDNIIIPPDKEELGWKDTVRMAPLEDTIVALRPIVPELPWEIPNAIRNLNPMDPAGSTKLFFSVDVAGQPAADPITNQLVNYGWGYVWHCHILSHEEMDMMRPQTLALPPVAPNGLTNTLQNAGGTNRRAVLTWNDNSITETSFAGAALHQPGQHLDHRRHHQLAARTRPTSTSRGPSPTPRPFNPTTTTRYYRVVAQNTVGYGQGMPADDGARPTPTPASSARASPSRRARAPAAPSRRPARSTVGRAGSQTFTFAPNAGYRIDQVLVDGVNDPTAVPPAPTPSPTCRPTTPSA